MRWLFLPLLVLLAGCDFFSPPCTKVTRKICDVGSEGDSCAFLLNVPKDDERTQSVCNAILVSAKDLAESPASQTARAEWKAAREKLGEVGFKANELKGRIETKLKEAGGAAGKLVETLEKNAAEGEERVREAAEKVLDLAKQ